MPIPPPPPPPPGPPPPPTLSQANTEPPKLSREEQRGRGALLQDICKGTKLRKVTQINDRSAPILEKPKGSGGGGSYGSSSAAIQPKGGLFQGGVPKLRPVGAKDSSDSSTKQTLQVPGSRAAAPRPPVPASNSRPQDDADSSRGSPPELPRTQRPSLPDLSRPGTAGGTGMKHSSSAPPPPPPGRRAAAPPAPAAAHAKASPYNREKPLPPTPGQRPPGSRDGPPAPPPIKPPPSPVSLRSGAQGQSLAPPPPPYRQPPGVPNGPSSPSSELAPELPQRHNSLHRKAPGPLRGLAPPPPTAASPSLQSSRPPPPARDPPSRGAAPAMASSSPQSQPTIAFPRTRSARRLAAPSAKSDPEAPALRPSPRSKASGPAGPGQATPDKRSGRATAQPLSPTAQPLSPRKRLGDDNLCNVPHAVPCSPAKRSKENRGRRLLFGDPSASPEQPKGPGPSPRSRGTRGDPTRSPETPRSSGLSRQQPPARLFRQEGTCYQQAKQVLHAAVPEQLQGRERETRILRQFLQEHVLGRRPGSLYVSGAPGTGKTACLSRVLLDCKDKLAGSRTVVLNCMALGSPQSVFPALAQHLGLPVATGRECVRSLEKHLTAKGPMVLLVLDELDQLESKGQDVLYTLFEWPQLPGSRLVLVGLANALDLTDRSLARLGAHPAGSPRLLHFPPYTKEQLTRILQERLGQVAGDPVLDSAALQFCARKVSAVSGDARKALDVCRRAVEVVELEVRGQTLLKPLPGGDSPASPVPKRVGLLHISRVLSEVFGDRLAGGSRGAQDTFPLQQKVLLCSLLLLARHSHAREVTLGKLHDTYSQVCRRQQLPAVDQAECLSLVTLLESRGVLELKRAKEARLAKVSLSLEEAALEHKLQDTALVGSILAQGLH